MIWKHVSTMPLLAYVSYERRARSLHISVKNHDSSTRLWQYLMNRSFSNVIDREAMLVLNRACTQKIILAVYKIVCGKKGQEEKIFQCYVVQGLGMLNVIIIMMIYHIAPNFCGIKFSWFMPFCLESKFWYPPKINSWKPQNF